MSNNDESVRKLFKLGKKFDRLKRFLSAAGHGIEKDIEEEIDKKFRAGKDPYGDPWPRRQGSYNHPILNRTGFLKRSFKVKVVKKDDILVEYTAPYAGYVHGGTKFNPPRRLIPTGSTLPASWRKIIEKHLRKQWKRMLK